MNCDANFARRRDRSNRGYHRFPVQHPGNCRLHFQQDFLKDDNSLHYN